MHHLYTKLNRSPEASSIPARGELRCSASAVNSKKSTTVVLTITELYDGRVYPQRYLLNHYRPFSNWQVVI